MWKCVVFVLCTFAILVESQDNFRDVTIVQGTVRGHLDPVNELYEFFNIPYATAPTGLNRFKAPLPPPVFMTTFDARNRNIICPQPFGLTMNMQEDCLVANVFAPQKATPDPKLPVLVVVHDGEYQYGHGGQETFRELVKPEPVIVVTFNYRLGVHGFLCLGTEGAPGNAGLKDQVALLRWVNTNIASFGGNPENVTLAGCSAGSGSVDFLTLSNITKGLFKKAIMESGVSTGAVGVQIDPIENAKYYAKLLDFSDVDDLIKLEEFYKTATFQTLISRHEAITNNQDVAIRFGPCVESDIGQERVVFDAPFSILKDGNYTKIPLMYGFTNMNGAVRLPFFNDWSKEMNQKFSNFLPAELHFDSDAIKEEVAQNVTQLYFDTDPVSEANVEAYITYFTDVLFGYPMLRSLTTRVEACDDTIYLFEYSFVDDNAPPVFPNTEIRGAQQCHQFKAVMDDDETDKTDEYQKMKATMREYWLNFILSGSPTRDSDSLQWQQAGPKGYPYMSLGNLIEKKEEEGILGERAALWDAIYEEYYRGPVMPVTTPPAETTTSVTTTSETTTSDTTTSETTTSETITSEPTMSDNTTSETSTSEPTGTDCTTPETTTPSTSTTDTSTTVPTTPDPGSDGAIIVSNAMFVFVSLSFYFILY